MTDVRLRRLLGPAAIAAAGLAFLVSGSEAAERKAKPPTVTVGSNFYVAPFKSVAAGAKVRFQWEGGGFDFHDVRVKKGPVKFQSPLQAAGTFTTKKLRPGSYTLFCSQHPEEMRLNLKVKKR